MEEQPHISDDLRELYTLHLLSGDELAVVEEHLASCEHCRKRLRETEDYVRAMQEALWKSAD